MAIQLGHECLAETHDLAIGPALGIKVGATLAAADGQAGQSILENLLEAQELDDAGVHAGVKAQATLVGPQRRVELDAIALVDLHPALIVGPADAEHDLALRLDHALDDAVFVVAWIAFQQRTQALEDFLGGLVKLALRRAGGAQVR